MNDMQKLAVNLITALEERGWSQSDLVRHSGLKRAAVSVYCRGAALPSKVSMEKLSKALKCKPSDLLSDSVVLADIKPREGKPRIKTDRQTERTDTPTGLAVQPDGSIHLTIDKVVTLERAMKILALLA